MKRLLAAGLMCAFMLTPGSSTASAGDRRILFTADDDIWSIRPDGSGAVNLTSGRESGAAPRWSPDFGRVAFLSGTEDAPPTLMVMDAGHGEPRALAEHAWAFDWSPDGTKIVYSKMVESDDPLRPTRDVIEVVDVATGEQSRLTESGWEPQWSPDGSTVLFVDQVCNDSGGPLSNSECNGDLYTIEVETQETKRLTTAPGEDWDAAWSPDGKTIVFSTARHDTLGTEDGGPYTSELYLIDADGSSERRLTRDKRAKDVAPAFSPDGRRIAFLHGYDDDVSDRDAEIFLIRTDGSSLRQVTADRAYNGDPHWSPRGRRLVYTANARTRDGSSYTDLELFRVDLRSGRSVRLTRNERHDAEPYWWSV